MTTIGASDHSKSKFLSGLEDETPTEVGGLASVWCVGSIVESCLAVIHIVETVD
ncbi:hypothetical protein [Zooshikella harenae]|uniref:Uncharacterized protein n=1 Tax=Zooshikella harenae TaxID=2827238 RepID=A0ABS5ZJX5_9GAMM|nr:hypothetical protein [Zooshikella harenae]MBU2714245.1 hypothetical protein [Zooshikella harenae]